MINIGLTTSQMSSLGRMLCSDHNVDIEVSLMDLNHKTLDDLSWRLLDGQVNIKAGDQISRSASLVLFDGDKGLGLDRANPASGALYYNRMIQIRYCVWQTGYGVFGKKRIEIPIFTGPITKMKRNGVSVSIDCMGKEILSQVAIWDARNYSKGANKVAVIRSIMANGSGERFFLLKSSSAKLPAKLSLGRVSIPWTEASRLARSLGMRLFYNGAGYLVLRRDSTKPVFTFRDGIGGSVMTEPDISYNLENVINRVWVTGVKKGKKPVPSAVVSAPSTHPLSGVSLGRKLKNGTVVPRVLLMKIDDQSIKTDQDAKTRAQKALNIGLLQEIQITVDTLPIVFLEEYDRVKLSMQGKYAIEFLMKDFSIPLSGQSLSSIGVNKNLKLKRRK